MLDLGTDRHAEAPLGRSRGGLLSDALVEIEGLNHYFGSGTLRKQILFDVSLRVVPGEIVLVTGPSGSGKTTLLTLIGALRTTQEGSLNVLGEELHGASEAALVKVRRSIGYVFQHHNLLNSLTVSDNVLTALVGERDVARRDAEQRARELLRAVGLEEHVGRHPDRLSGGQKQRVAIARALAGRPRIILADEPTASLDKQSGRDVVSLIHDLAKKHGCAVLLVTHDNRILDIADRIVHLEEGRLTGFAEAVLANTQHMLATLAQVNRKGELGRQVEGLSSTAFQKLLEQVTGEARQFLQVLDMSKSDAFESMLEQVLHAFTLKIGQLTAADRVSLFLVDEARGELWSKVAQFGENERAIEIRLPLGEGIAGRVAQTGEPMNLADAYESPLFKREVDQTTGYRTRSVLCMPILDRNGKPFAVTQLINRRGGEPFDARDEAALRDFTASIGIVLESWRELTRERKGDDRTGVTHFRPGTLS